MGLSHPHFYRYDPEVGHRHRPGAEGWFTREGRSYVRISSQGLRDVEHNLTEPEGSFRILVLGDSYAEGLQVELEQTFWRVAQRRVITDFPSLPRHLEFINFGVSGYGTAQELIALREYGWTYKPDLVLLTITTGNDIRNNSMTLESERMRPFFFLDDGNLVVDKSFRGMQGSLRRKLLPAVTALSDRLWVVQNVLQIMKNLRTSSRLDGRRRSPTNSPPSAEVGLDWEVLAPPRDAAWDEAWAVSEALITAMANDVTDRGARLAVVVVSNPVQVHPDGAVYRNACEHLGVDDLFYADHRIEALCESLGLPCLTLAPRAVATGIYFHGFEGNLGSGHWNRDGHQAAGELIADFLGELIGSRSK
jgi:lysophospholipase L1-like esterase